MGLTAAMRVLFHYRVAILAAVIVPALASCSQVPYLPANQKTTAAAQDAVYEAVVRDMSTAARGETQARQLVFSDSLLSERRNGENEAACKEAVRKRENWLADAPPYNSIFDKTYRFMTRGRAYDSAWTETVEDFLEKSCGSGHLSETFRTDLPKVFIASEDVWFDTPPAGKPAAGSFERMFPGAAGIISFSPVGFSPSLDQAIVSVSFVCGGLCGTGWRYILVKRRGNWEVAVKRVTWVS